MVLTLLLIGFLALAAGVSVRWVLRRVDALGRIAPFPKISVGLCLAVAIGCAVPLWLHAQLERTLQHAATEIAGSPVQVDCQTSGQAFMDVGVELGYVRWGPGGIPEHRTLIKYTACADLRSWLSSGKQNPTEDQIIAVHVLTHETMHMVGLTNEAHAECAAMQRDAAMAVALGATTEQAQTLARRYWLEVYPRMSADYTGGCGPGGEFDEHVAVPPW